MCLAGFALGAHERFEFVLAANRDESFARPTAPMAWWTPSPDAPPLLAGRDLQAGGTWLGLNAAGRLALLTNVRRPASQRSDAPSRGGLVTGWLRGDADLETFWSTAARAGHNPFNLVMADLARGECHWAGWDGARAQRLAPGVHAVSNAALDVPWPKVERVREALREALAAEPADAPALADRLFDALADRRLAPDARLPSTGVPPDVERALSSVFISLPGRGYGTRCSSVVIVERTPCGREALILERPFDASARAGATRAFKLPGWPPRAAA